MSIYNTIVKLTAVDDYVLILQLIIFFILILLKILRWVHFWQIKEYRHDRMREFLMSASGKKETINFFTSGEFLFVLFFFLDYFHISFVTLLPVFFWIFIITEIIFFLRHRLRPVWTLKSILIVCLTAFSTFLLTLGADFYANLTIALSLTIFLCPLSCLMIVIILNPLSNYKKRKIILTATNYVRQLSPKIIGITGSYGKTTTKEFLHEILATHFKVLATEKNTNTDIGIAKMVLEKLKPDHEICIIEMGAYKPGEIRAICKITPPIIGVLTAVSSQHLALFGSLEAIKNAKAELLEALPASGLAVINYDCESCLELSERTRAIYKFYSLKSVVHAYATDITCIKKQLSFVLHLGKKASWVRTNLIGRQNISSILASTLTADHLGVPFSKIIKSLEKIRPLKGTMSVLTGRQGVTIIDDHYNSNPDGFLAALDYLALWTDKRKVVITPGMIELGSETDSWHRQVGTRIGEVADLLIISKKDQARNLQDAAKKTGLTVERILIDDNVNRLLKKLSGLITNDDVILFEGRCFEKIYKYFTKL